jgi:hypothetical protein
MGYLALLALPHKSPKTVNFGASRVRTQKGGALTSKNPTYGGNVSLDAQLLAVLVFSWKMPFLMDR